VALNPWRLRLLVQLETLGTVRAVAQAVHQSASSVSQQLGVLEQEAGAQLFERMGRGVRLTPTGHMLARRARDILDAMAVAEAELRSLDSTPVGLVHVASFQSAIHALVLPAVAALREKAPHVEVHVEEMEAPASTSALLRGDADVIITSPDLVESPLPAELYSVPLLTDSIVAVAPRGHRIEKLERVDLATLAGEPWTFEREGSYLSTLALRLCRSAGFEPHVVCRLNNYLLALQQVEAGGCVTLLPELAIVTRYDVVTRELSPPTSRRIMAATRSSSTDSSAVRAVLDAFRQQVDPAPA
jgi:DNA-binding transcriptional LysR family regulator